ncbi:MAG: division/cell wall cluster transcriptional repressor MraZ [Sphingomonas fennica]
MDIVDFFLGNALNAVDAKGRVSLPSDFRAVIERRARAAAATGNVLDAKTVSIGEHEKHACLQAFDATYAGALFRQLQQRVAQAAEADQMAALDDAQADAFGAMLPVSFDAAGRMVLSAQLRATAGIRDLAFFVGSGQTFQIWDPRRYLEEQADKARVCRTLRFLLAERGVEA